MKPKILLLFAGGTIGMVPNPKTGALQPAQSALEVLNNIPELSEIADIDFELVANVDSSNMVPDHWIKLAQIILAKYHDYDGFVVAQGTDTMAYSASALSYALGNLGKPVVFTGSLIPLLEIGSDARNNLLYACMTASLDIAEVCIVMSNQILRGNRAKKHHESFVAAFHSPNFPELGELGRPIVLNEWCHKRHNGELEAKIDFDRRIVVIKLFPGFNPDILEHLLSLDIRAIVIEGFGPGNVPFLETSIIPGIIKAREKNIVVLIANQMERGKTHLEAYEAGLKAKEAGAISAHDMTTEAAVTKLMWALPQASTIEEIDSIMSNNIAGELI
ncbi:MAG: asparaginase [Patescibacteria group bacterium]|nr:asparaginase [Patescibacteria group bacterium]